MEVRAFPLSFDGFRLLSESLVPPDDLHLNPHSTPISILDDDSLLNIFRLYCPALLDGDESDGGPVIGGWKWERVRWWYNLVHVCRRWRHLVLSSASHLGLCLLCTHGTPVADMLAHSPPFPLVLDHYYRHTTASDIEQILLTLQYRDRVRRIRIIKAVPIVEEFIAAIDDEFLMLESLCIAPEHNTSLALPKTFQAPRLRHLILSNLAHPMGSPPLLGAADLVTLSLSNLSYTYFGPDALLGWVLLLPRLETLWIDFYSPFPSADVERDLMHMRNMTYVTHPTLCNFTFRGVIMYLEAFLSRITAPHLDVLHIKFFIHPTFSVPYLLEFMSMSENLRFRSAQLSFGDDGVTITACPHETVALSPFSLRILNARFDLQVSSVARILYVLSPVFSSVVDLTLKYQRCSCEAWAECQNENEADLARWRTILRSFHNVDTLRIPSDLVTVLSRSLQPNGESPMDLFPRLKELIYSASSMTGDAFTGFIDARQNAGCPVTLIRN